MSLFVSNSTINEVDDSKWIVSGNENAKVDCFYVMPTIRTDDDYIIPVNNTTQELAKNKVEKGTIAFKNQTKIYAPYYRQVSLNGFYKTDDKAIAAHSESYEDVKNAFYYYYFNINKGKKPFFIVGHSQGSYHISKLLKDIEKDPNIDKNLIIAIYATGWKFDKSYFTDGIQLSSKSDDTGKLITFSSVASVEQIETNPYGGGVQINPLTWTNSSKKANNQYTSVFYHNGKTVDIGKVFETAQIINGNLVLGGFNEEIVNEYKLDEYGNKNLHTLENELFDMSISENVKLRIDSYFSKK
ncbi:MAG: DUF3089 domain-containing protein [Methanobacteriaceae archaeon]